MESGVIERFDKLSTMTSETGNSFTALLELPPNQAMELLTDAPPLPALVSRDAKYSVFVEPVPVIKAEPADSGSDPAGGSESDKSLKRKGGEKKGKSCSKKSKTTPVSEDGEKLPYVHVRARRGQATDSHSLAERARREKINARMKLLQELVPGCNKISGTSLVLDEIINHVQYLQRQVEYLSMRLAAVNPRIDYNFDSVISAGVLGISYTEYNLVETHLITYQTGILSLFGRRTDEGMTESMMDCNFPNMAMPFMWPEIQMSGERQQLQQQWHFEPLSQPVWVKEENHQSFVASENSLLSYDSPANSASLPSSQLKMEL